jgi:2,3-bisphosphoglycerate-independent phosphoglycerate mutase
MALLLLFIDGLGLGARADNPLSAAEGALRLERGAEVSYSYAGGALRAADATMGVKGLPQSATGQTAIFTGVNTAGVLGRHLSGWPSGRLRELLRQDSIFIRLTRAGLRTTFANAFSPAYFLRPVGRMSASTLHMLYAGLKPRWVWQIPEGEAVFQDFTNSLLLDSGFGIDEQAPEDAGRTLAAMLDRQDFVLYEYFITDAAAHRRIRIEPTEVVRSLERMISALLKAADLERHCIALCSDHGNIEDCSNRSHTRNPVPLLAWGDGASDLFRGVTSITGIADAVSRHFGLGVQTTATQ